MTQVYKSVVIFCFLLLTLWHGTEGRKVLLQDVNVITLNHGQMTNARRSSAVPQLKCTGGSAGCRVFKPQTVQCYNRGWDGYDVQWECKTDMDKRYRFGQIVVSCEGYEYADDTYILAGSCGLEYDIDYVNEKNTGSYWGNSYATKSDHGGFGFSSVFGFLFVIMIVFFVYRTCFATPTDPLSSFTGAGGTTHGGTGPYTNDPPPPYGFRSDYCSGQSSAPPPPYSATSNNNNGQPGFFSGLASGAFLGYLFGNRGGYGNRPNSYYNDGYQRDWFGSPTSSYSGFSSSNSSGGSRTASGFGGTKRR